MFHTGNTWHRYNHAFQNFQLLIERSLTVICQGHAQLSSRHPRNYQLLPNSDRTPSDSFHCSVEPVASAMFGREYLLYIHDDRLPRVFFSASNYATRKSELQHIVDFGSIQSESIFCTVALSCLELQILFTSVTHCSRHCVLGVSYTFFDTGESASSGMAEPAP
jgi:hypothetical protein